MAHRRAVRRRLEAAGVPEGERAEIVRRVLAEAATLTRSEAPPAHRALADAQAELALWQVVLHMAEVTAQRDR